MGKKMCRSLRVIAFASGVTKRGHFSKRPSQAKKNSIIPADSQKKDGGERNENQEQVD